MDDTQQKISPKNVFLNLLSIITLYISAGSFIALLFQHVNYFFPDMLTDYRPSLAAGLRWAIAALLIIFPTHIIVSRLLQKEFVRSPAERERRLRKWLLYFTLFTAALLIIGDLVTLIYYFLGGDLSTRFIFKVLAVLLTGGMVFWYYLAEIRREAPALPQAMRLFAWLAIAAVAAGVIGGFFVAGSPFAERLKRFDERRVQDLQNIQWQIVEFWRNKEKLPGGLPDLTDNISGFRAATDPETGVAYEYRVTGALSFELCAVFNTDQLSESVSKPLPMAFSYSDPQYYNEVSQQNWAHGRGRTCFSRAIDPEIYKIKR
ncbi:MAG: hypothetical protein UY71_C0007G0011 [Parcubacteria group bacterium GW2011_GWB1_52_7]|nr:MAG: hypothetical protein UY64_C0010G0014 [Parcubacteria group bacterium GW2011_GWA1_51_12]KKW28927.1 MAG: hypothetical protein UY71_C0007G0011 [Parcubacteria group bacterium GW2011_GWB1_52_7]KKW30929.1 MAG: hypothetical protein UY75_C0021G0009 [Parcubacteria group bacterium GW2011_GWC2_52_8c]